MISGSSTSKRKLITTFVEAFQPGNIAINFCTLAIERSKLVTTYDTAILQRPPYRKQLGATQSGQNGQQHNMLQKILPGPKSAI